MARVLHSLCALTLLLASGQLSAATESQMASIKALGLINGVALSCQRLEQTQRMKQAIVSRLPKVRVLGDLFDHASNDAFLAFSAEGQLCPTKSKFDAQVNAAIEVLNENFPKK